MSEPFDLVVLELHGRPPPADGHHDLELSALRVEVVDGALEVHERPLDDAHLVALLERRLELRLLRAFLPLAEGPVDPVGGARDRGVAPPPPPGGGSPRPRWRAAGPAWPPSPRTPSPSASSARGARCRRSAPSPRGGSPGRTSARSRSSCSSGSPAPSPSAPPPGRSSRTGRRSWRATRSPAPPCSRTPSRCGRRTTAWAWSWSRTRSFQDLLHDAREPDVHGAQEEGQHEHHQHHDHGGGRH